MERANYEFWSTVEEISISQAAYLWCDCEPPPDEPEIVEHLDDTHIMIERAERPRGGRIKGKNIPQIVKLVLFQLIQAAISGQLLLKDGRKLEVEKIKPWLIPKTPNDIGPETPNIFSNVFTTKKRLREYAESIGQHPKFLFPDSTRDKIIRSVGPGVEKIYDPVKKLGFSGRDPTPPDKKMILYRKEALKELPKIENKYPLIKREFLIPELFDNIFN